MGIEENVEKKEKKIEINDVVAEVSPQIKPVKDQGQKIQSARVPSAKKTGHINSDRNNYFAGA